MKKARILSGEQLVHIGATKHKANLPELGVKHVIPTGSWLESKQIQAAIENRKHLLEIEKIEKRGVLSKAEWDEELGLAEVTQIVGGHWQYLGHTLNKKTYLRPEEALYLLESNSLQLTHNDVTVSVQKAYALLLSEKLTLKHYKVYASLSRVGYKILRHEPKKSNSIVESTVDICSLNNIEVDKEIVENTEQICSLNNTELDKENDNSSKNKKGGEVECEERSEDDNEKKQDESINTESEKEANSTPEITGMDIEIAMNNVESTNDHTEDREENLPEASTSTEVNKPQTTNKYISRKEMMLKKLKERKYSALSGNTIEQCFKNVPDMIDTLVVQLQAPEESLLPRKVFPYRKEYMIDIDRARVRNTNSTERRPYSVSDEVNGIHIRRIRGPENYTDNRSRNDNRNHRNQHNTPYFSLFNFQRWRNPQFGYPPLFQDGLINFPPRSHSQFQRNSQPQFQRFHQNFSHQQRPNTFNGTNSSRRSDTSTREAHLFEIKYLLHAVRTTRQDLATLTRLVTELDIFNTRYGTKLRLIKPFKIIDEGIMVTQVINLEDEETPPAKRPKVDDSKYKENLKSIEDLSKRLVEMAKKGQAFARYRRALSNAIKTFNNAYNTDLFLREDNEICNLKEKVIDSSDSDCFIEEPPQTSKKLRNPFNILIRPSLGGSTSENEAKRCNETSLGVKEKYEESIVKNFKKWLPPESDFGRPEIIEKADSFMFMQNIQTESFLFDYLKEYNFSYENWCEVKTSFWESLNESKSPSEAGSDSNTSNESLLSTEDFTDLRSMLAKISVIRNCNDTLCDGTLSIDFDVYNRDVQNFRKTCPPAPHYRVICIDEDTPIPSAAEVATLHAKYPDNVPILFAIVGTGSINYVQMKPSDIPIYLPNSEDFY